MATRVLRFTAAAAVAPPRARPPDAPKPPGESSTQRLIRAHIDNLQVLADADPLEFLTVLDIAHRWAKRKRRKLQSSS